MKRIFLFFALLILIVDLSNGQTIPASKAKRVSIEESAMITSWQGGFFPIFNNELSVNCRVDKWASLGVFYDYYHDTYQYEGGKTISNQHLTGLRVAFSPLSFWKNYDESKWAKFDLFLNAYIAYDFQKESIHITYSDKKDRQTWANYYKINATYNLNSTFYINLNAGIINSDRIMIGIGVNL